MAIKPAAAISACFIRLPPLRLRLSCSLSDLCWKDEPAGQTGTSRTHGILRPRFRCCRIQAMLGLATDRSTAHEATYRGPCHDADHFCALERHGAGAEFARDGADRPAAARGGR